MNIRELIALLTQEDPETIVLIQNSEIFNFGAVTYVEVDELRTRSPNLGSDYFLKPKTEEICKKVCIIS